MNRILNILDDSLHPGTPPAWVAGLVLLAALLLTWRLGRIIRRARRENHPHHRAVRAHHQKIHEGERW